MKDTVRAAARTVKKHRVFFLFVMGLFTIGLIAGTYAVQSGATFSGQTQAGDHNWWDKGGGDAFCSNCHTAIGQDLTDSLSAKHSAAGSVGSCSSCHTAGKSDHAAATAQCTDCHDKYVTELLSPTEAHGGILASLGEGYSPDYTGPAGPGPGASQTCQSCHTHAAVDMTITADAPIPLKMGG